MVQTGEVAPLPRLQIGPILHELSSLPEQMWVYGLNQRSFLTALINNTQYLRPSFPNETPDPFCLGDTVKFKMCKLWKTQLDGRWKNSKWVREASQGPNNAHHLLPPWQQCKSSFESSDPESLETCQGDLLSRLSLLECDRKWPRIHLSTGQIREAVKLVVAGQKKNYDFIEFSSSWIPKRAPDAHF